jgi:predicted phosphodiesterase
MKPTAILTGDIHLRDTCPISRKDNYWLAQEKKIIFIMDLQEKYGIPIIDSGDLLHKAYSSPFLESWAINNLPPMITIPGNHDLPNHNLDLFHKSSLSVLNSALNMRVIREPKEGAFIGGGIYIYGFYYGCKQEFKNIKSFESTKRKVAIIHDMVYESEIDPNIPGQKSISLLKKFKDADLILTGHNHKNFVVEYQKRLLVNVGSMMRMTADQIDYQPKIYLWYADNNTLEEIYLPIEKDVIDRNQLDRIQEKDKRLLSFVERINDNFEISLSFNSNLENYFKKNKTRKAVQDIIMEAING